MDIKAERRQLLAQIEALADEAHRRGMAMAVPTELKMYGLRVPQIRDLAEAWSREHKTVELKMENGEWRIEGDWN
ncbi:MAG: DNA alkylation repair protein [Anaerolineae bacterium]